jgi:hypothetical protein
MALNTLVVRFGRSLRITTSMPILMNVRARALMSEYADRVSGLTPIACVFPRSHVVKIVRACLWKLKLEL